MSKALSNHSLSSTDHQWTSAPDTKSHLNPLLDDEASPQSGLSNDRFEFEDWHASGGAVFGHHESSGAPGSRLALFSGNDASIPLVDLPHVVGSAGQPSGSPAGTASSAGSAALVANAASAFVINVTYDSSANSAPTAFKTAVAAVVQYFETQFTDPITINIAVGYGEAGGAQLNGALGMSLTYLTNTTYASLRSALIADAKTADDATATSVASLPATDPTGTNHFWLATAEAKALGLAVPAVPVDGYVGFSNTAAFDYDNSNGITGGQYDFYGVVAHEISEVMGRFLLVGESIQTSATTTILNNYDALDLFHYSAPGVRDFAGTQAGYSSLNGGTTKLYDFNTNPGGDFGDLAASAGNNSFLAFANSGAMPVTAADIQIMDAIGWDAAASSPPPPPPPPPPAPADLTVTSLTLHDTTVSFQIHNGGTGSAAASTAGIYLSTDGTITTSDILLTTISTPSLAANGSFNANVALSFPSHLTPGTYRIGVIADNSNQIAENNEANNASTTSLPVLLGNSSVNVLTGTSGNDTIIGLGNGDTLIGGAGKDTLIGNSGSDHFRYNAKTDGLDTIVDFSTFSDVLDFSQAAFGAGLATGGASTGTLSSSHFVANGSGTANAAAAQFVYNSTTHILSFDSDGSGAASAIQLAQLENGVLLNSNNIHLV